MGKITGVIFAGKVPGRTVSAEVLDQTLDYPRSYFGFQYSHPVRRGLMSMVSVEMVPQQAWNEMRRGNSCVFPRNIPATHLS